MKKLLSLVSIMALFVLAGCTGGGETGGDSSGVLFATEGQLDFSGTYATTLPSEIRSALGGHLNSFTLSQYGSIVEAIDNLGNRYRGTISGGIDVSGNGAIETNEAAGILEMEAVNASGIRISIVAASDSEVTEFVPGTSSTSQALVVVLNANYFQTETTTTQDKTTVYKQFSGQIVLSTGQSGTITMKGDIVVTGGGQTSSVALVPAA